ncbi:MAG: phosphotransferase [Candidatus Hydrogenedentes bacterium]|nr:phosphotransferase [Candidatus Hydrogenedentota bacterium]
MGLREESIQNHPDFPWLDAEDRDGVARCLMAQGLLENGESVESVSSAGEGNMNLTLRVVTNRREFVLKQARPWVEKYPEIAAPWDRILFEQRYYQRGASIPEVARRSPHLLGVDCDSRTIVMEYIAHAEDLTSVYTGANISREELDTLAGYLAALHESTSGEFTEDFANREMRALNHEHIFVIPFTASNGLELDVFEPGLMDAAARLIADTTLCETATSLGQRYLADGECLLHGDYFPGSWMRNGDGLWVIDPEFCYYGDPEFDLGVATAHFAIAQRPQADAAYFVERYTETARAVDHALLARYAGTEVIRRLIGVAQLPLPPTDGFRSRLLDGARAAVLESSWETLWEA